MAGEARSNQFMLGSATVMIGTPDEVFDLTPEEHSIGLVKNFQVSSEPSYTEMTQGVKNQTVYSVMTANTVKASMEVYEYTARNISYALGLEAGSVVQTGATTTVSAPASASDTNVTVDDESGFAVGDYIIIQDGEDDQVYVRKLTTAAAGSLGFVQPLPRPIATGATVKKSTAISVGSKEEQPFLAAKIVGHLADKSPVTFLCPKIRITNGFSVSFTTDNFGNLPFEFSFYDLITGDPHYADFKGEQCKMIL